MNFIEQIDIMSMLDESIANVFDTMVSIPVAASPASPPPQFEGGRLVGSVSLTGKVTGSVNFHISGDFARLITADMLGMVPEEIEGWEEVEDVIGEVSNMIGGDLKSRLCDGGLPCDLSIPSVTSGRDFKIETMGFNRHEHVVLQHDSHNALVEVFFARSF